MQPDSFGALQDPHESWQALARCRGQDAALFFTPSTTEKRDEKETRELKAKAFCRGCPVSDECLDFALDTREPYGIWGGLNELERRRMIARRAG